MRLQFLGTAAAEGIPAPFCSCEICENARKRKGREIRTRAQCLLDEDILLDLGPDTLMHSIVHDLDYRKLRGVLVTHSHSDHYIPEIMLLRHGVFSKKDYDEPLYVYGGEIVTRKFDTYINGVFGKNDIEGSVIAKYIPPYEWADILDMQVMPLIATHGGDEECYIYIVKRSGKTLLYGNDTGILSERSMAEVMKHKYDLVVLDCTCGKMQTGSTHMCLADNIALKEALDKNGCSNDGAKYISTHFSHNGKVSYTEITELTAKNGMLASYDGMIVEV